MKYVFRKKRNIILVGIFDALGYVLTRPFARKPRRLPADFKSILIIRIDHLGDVLSSTAIPKVIKENFSECRVTFLTSSWAAPLLENNPFVNEVLIFDAPWFYKKRYKKSSQSLSFWKLIRALRSRKIEMGIGLRGDLRENLIMALGGLRERIGFGEAGGGFLLTREVPYRMLSHESEHRVDLLRTLGIRNVSLEAQLYFSEKEETLMESRLPLLGLTEGRKYVGFQLDAGTEAKEWPIEYMRSFLGQFQTRFPGREIVLIGSNKKRLKELTDPLNLKFIDLIGRTSLRDLCLLMRRFEFFIGPDSGPTHIAAALGVPSVFLYSGTNVFEQWKPLSEAAVILRHPVPCSPCHLEVCNVPGHPCMSEIRPEALLKVLEEKLR
ncbi:MAG: glycosyltransferase family 9 protein [Candidatus Omnitrophota bacterium]